MSGLTLHLTSGDGRPSCESLAPLLRTGITHRSGGGNIYRNATCAKLRPAGVKLTQDESQKHIQAYMCMKKTQSTRSCKIITVPTRTMPAQID